MPASFDEDLAAYRAAGVGGIGVCEFKLPADGARLLRESGLRATACVPAVAAILPPPPISGPGDPEEGIAALFAARRRRPGARAPWGVFLARPRPPGAPV